MNHTVFFLSFFFTIPFYCMNENTPLLDKRENTDHCHFEKTLQVKGQSTATMLFDPEDSNKLYSGSSDKTVKIWDINNNTYEELPKASNNKGKTVGTNCIAINSNCTLLVAGGWGRSIVLFDLKRKRLKKVLTIKKNKYAQDPFANILSSLTFGRKDNFFAASLNGDYSIYGQTKNTIALFNTDNDNQVTLTGNMENLKHIAMNPYDEKNLIAMSYRKVSFWDIEHEKCLREVNNEDTDATCVHDIAFHPEENQFFTTNYYHPYKVCSSLINLWDVKQEKIVGNFKLNNFGKDGIAHLAIHPNKKEIIASSYHLTQIFDIGTKKLIEALPNKRSSLGNCFCTSSVNNPKHNAEIRKIAISNDGKKLATLAGTIKIWNHD